ncbi:hypothetical protein RN001_007199 [Aquatica leii]|uniref:Beta-defensin n=1 Tax=Aquatica leii TaxID=1421715 RepID=A0AAN7P994_9COLE|nr:hypothetical protein RN001_007199 [Aquatica leii]
MKCISSVCVLLFVAVFCQDDNQIVKDDNADKGVGYEGNPCLLWNIPTVLSRCRKTCNFNQDAIAHCLDNSRCCFLN